MSQRNEFMGHPNNQRLQMFLEGKLSEQHIIEIENHLDGCPDCCLELQTLDGRDPLTRALRGAYQVQNSHTVVTPQTEVTSRLSEFTDRSPATNDPKQFARFRLIRELGQGGFGMVWLAKDPDLGREIALKIPRTGSFISHDMKHRFLREAKAAAALCHDNVLQVFEAGEANGICYIASEYCPGSDLEQWLETHPAPSPQIAAWIVYRIGLAVSHAHEHGVLHRDLKPSNVLLARVNDGEKADPYLAEFGFVPKVADFGLAKIIDSDEEETATQSIIGSVAFMSPEQAQGESANAQSDVYSLGSILYRLLAGRTPHAGKPPLESLRLASQENAPAPSSFRSSIPLDLDTICLKCMDRQPSRRYDSAADLYADLYRFLNGEPISARPISVYEKMVLWCRRKPWIVAVWTLLAITTLSAMTFSWVFMEQRNESSRRLDAQVIAERETKLALFEANLKAVRLGRLGTHVSRRFEGLEAADKAVSLLEELQLGDDRRLQLRNEVIGCLSLFDIQVDAVWKSRVPQTGRTGIAIDSLCQKYAHWAMDGGLEIRDMESNQVLNRISNADLKLVGEINYPLQFSPDSRFLATNGARDKCNFRVWDLENDCQVVLDLSPGSLATGSSFAFSRDSRQIVTNQYEFVIYSLPSGEEEKRFGSIDFCFQFEFSPNDQELVSVGNHIQIVDPKSGKKLREFDFDVDPSCVAWHPAENQIAFSIGNQLFETQPENLGEDWIQHAEAMVGHTNPIVSVEYSANGRLIATSSWDGTTCIWGAEEHNLIVQADRTAISFSQDDRFLAFGMTGAEIGRWQIADGFERQTLRHVGSVETLGFSLDGRLLTAAGNKCISTWDTSTGRLLDRSEPGPISSFWPHPDDSQFWLAGSSGLFRSRVTVSEGDPVRVKIGKSEMVPVTGQHAYQLSGTPDGKSVAISRAKDSSAFMVLDSESTEAIAEGFSLPMTHRHSIHPDGNLVVASNWLGNRCNVFDIVNNKSIKSFRINSANCKFSPDGRWLVLGDGSSFQAYSVGDWKSVATIGRDQANWDAPLDFDSSGELVAICSGFQTVKLVETTQWTELASLATVQDGRIREIALSNNGELLAAGHWDDSITLWNLRRIREELKKHSLDWDAPNFPPQSPTQSAKSVVIEKPDSQSPVRQ